MKTLIVVRHAKSSWENTGTSDLDRPLNSRGKKDAPDMAKRLHKKIKVIDVFLSSPALRAYTTAQYFADEYKVNKKDIAVEKQLYNALPETFYAVLTSLPDEHQCVAVFSHNPGITGFVNTLSEVHIDDMPTCALFAVSANTAEWILFKNAAKQFLFFEYPENG